MNRGRSVMKRKELPKISDAEWEIMCVFWERLYATANQVVEALMGKNTWKPKTIRTLINRLVEKKALGYEKAGKEHLYHPLVAKEDCVRDVSRSFLKRIYGGTLQPMLAHFLEYEPLTNDEIDELKNILERKKK